MGAQIAISRRPELASKARAKPFSVLPPQEPGAARREATRWKRDAQHMILPASGARNDPAEAERARFRAAHLKFRRARPQKPPQRRGKSPDSDGKSSAASARPCCVSLCLRARKSAQRAKNEPNFEPSTSIFGARGLRSSRSCAGSRLTATGDHPQRARAHVAHSGAFGRAKRLGELRFQAENVNFRRARPQKPLHLRGNSPDRNATSSAASVRPNCVPRCLCVCETLLWGANEPNFKPSDSRFGACRPQELLHRR